MMMTTMVISHSLTPPPLIRPSLRRSHRLIFSETSSITRTVTSSRTRRNKLYSVMASSSSSSSSSSSEQTSDPWTNFPYLSPSGSRLMGNIAHTIASHLSSSLIRASRTPPEVCRFKNPQGNNEGSVILRSGASGSPIDFLLRSWLHCNLPFGTLNIATIVAMMNSQSDAPHLLFEFIQTNTNSLVLVLDLLPRKDLVTDLEYLKRFYEDTSMESVKQELQKSPYAQRYEPPTLYIRCLTSPTSILYKFECAADSKEILLDQIIEDVVAPTAEKVVKLWLEGVLSLGKKLPDEEVKFVVQRDTTLKMKGLEVDLSSNMPRLFGQEITDNVIEAFRKGE